MSQKGFEAVIGKAIVDAEFRKLLLADSAQALAGFELNETEIASLKGIDAETMDSMANSLDKRVSKVRVNKPK